MTGTFTFFKETYYWFRDSLTLSVISLSIPLKLFFIVPANAIPAPAMTNTTNAIQRPDSIKVEPFSLERTVLTLLSNVQHPLSDLIATKKGEVDLTSPSR